ncbi:MAG TPA: DNA repair protein RecN [Clostridiaceae bacterium]|nr:DNA repair protein RecN [Clostridiaceae bacterium]
MIHRVEIDNFALVEHSGLSFGAGLTVLSGETGAGKSIVVDALDFAIGGRSDRTMLRSGAEEAIISVLFVDERREQGDELIVTRGLRDNSRSYAKINGHLVTVAELRATTERLVAIHSQNDQQSIFRESVHQTLLDAFGGEPVEQALTSYTSKYEELRIIEKRLEELFSDPETRERRRNILQYQVEEIEGAEIVPGEEEQLLKKIRTASAVIEIATFIGQAMTDLSGDDEQSIQVRLGRVIANLNAASKHSAYMQDIRDRAESLRCELTEMIIDLERVYEKLDVRPDEMERASARLNILRRLQDKYGDDLNTVIAYGQKARRELDRLNRTEEELASLIDRKNELLNAMNQSADRLLCVRKACAAELSRLINAELHDLNMKNASFEVSIEALSIDENHAPADPQTVRFNIAPNPGEPLMPLISIVSGGEASRVLLAIKTVLASVDNVPTLIFDEIDTGISGKTTTMIAHKLKSIAEHCQVICVTHSAQIAAIADRHLLIGKVVEGGRTRTTVQHIDGEDRIREVARLLSGRPDDSASRVLAGQLIEGRGDH